MTTHTQQFCPRLQIYFVVGTHTYLYLVLCQSSLMRQALMRLQVLTRPPPASQCRPPPPVYSCTSRQLTILVLLVGDVVGEEIKWSATRVEQGRVGGKADYSATRYESPAGWSHRAVFRRGRPEEK